MSKYMVVAVDADATLLKYDKWDGVGVFGGPLKGARETLTALRQSGYRIVIWTTRGEITQLKAHLYHHKIPFDYINENPPDLPLNLSKKKILADVYVDDKALNFSGRWEGMFQKIVDFQPWYKTKAQRPTMPICVAGYYVDQVALYVAEINESVAEYSKIGHDTWVRDRVVAEMGGMEFEVDLGFNYTLYPVEFELICVRRGSTVQIPERPGYLWLSGSRRWSGLSHYGFHVDDILSAVDSFEANGFQLLSYVDTKSHTGTDKLYTYTFMDTSKLGFISKLICERK